MASDAGRVIPLPKGAWDINRNYEVLDIVNHNNQSWMAKLPSIGIEPTEGQFWTMYGSSVQKASTDAMGIVKIPSDGSMTIDADGTIGVTVDDTLDKASDMPIANSAVAEAIEGVNTAIDGKLAPSVVSDAYSTEKTYAVGEYCIYNDVLWKCKVVSKGVTPAEGATWDKCSVSGEISSLNNVLTKCGEMVVNESYGGDIGYKEFGFAIPNGTYFVEFLARTEAPSNSGWIHNTFGCYGSPTCYTATFVKVTTGGFGCYAFCENSYLGLYGFLRMFRIA